MTTATPDPRPAPAVLDEGTYASMIAFCRREVETWRRVSEEAAHAKQGSRSVGAVWLSMFAPHGRGAVGGNAAYDIQGTPRGTMGMPVEVAEHVAANDPASVWRRADAIDTILDNAEAVLAPAEGQLPDTPYTDGKWIAFALVVRAIASSFPGADPRWRP